MKAQIIAWSIGVTCIPGYTGGRETDYSGGASSSSAVWRKGSSMGESVTAVIAD